MPNEIRCINAIVLGECVEVVSPSFLSSGAGTVKEHQRQSLSTN